MTVGPVSISPASTLDSALRVMSERNVRHLPVVEGGRIVGMLSEREAQLALAILAGGSRASVEVAMSKDPYSVDHATPLKEVAREMALRKIGSVAVTADGALVGVFTTVDALALLSEVLTASTWPRQPGGPPSAAPSEGGSGGSVR